MRFLYNVEVLHEEFPYAVVTLKNFMATVSIGHNHNMSLFYLDQFGNLTVMANNYDTCQTQNKLLALMNNWSTELKTNVLPNPTVKKNQKRLD